MRATTVSQHKKTSVFMASLESFDLFKWMYIHLLASKCSLVEHVECCTWHLYHPVGQSMKDVHCMLIML